MGDGSVLPLESLPRCSRSTFTPLPRTSRPILAASQHEISHNEVVELKKSTGYRVVNTQWILDCISEFAIRPCEGYFL